MPTVRGLLLLFHSIFFASLVMRVLAHICRVVSFSVKTRVMGHFVDLNCARRAYCVVVNEKRAVCTVSANFQNI